MTKMISKMAHRYAERELKPGDPFEADQEYVATLITLGRAELAPMQSDATKYQTRDMGAPPETHQKTKYHTKHKVN